jgi:subtilisin family serine protease
MTSSVPLRQYAVLKATPELLRIYPRSLVSARSAARPEKRSRPPSQEVPDIQFFADDLLKKLGAPPQLAKTVKVESTPSFAAVPEIEGLDPRELKLLPDPDELIIGYGFADETSLRQFRELVQAKLGVELDAEGNAFLWIGADPGGTTQDHFDPTAPDRIVVGDRRRARDLLGADALKAAGLDGADVNVVIIDEGLDKTLIPAANWGGGWPVVDASGMVHLPGMTTPGTHAGMIARNVLDLAPKAVIYDVPLLPPRISNVPLFIGEADGVWRTVVQTIRLLRGLPRWSGPWVLVNAWGIFDRRSELPNLGDYTENPNHAFNRTVGATVAQDGLDVVFAAGNCGQFDPSPRCGEHDRGPGHSIYGANSHPMVLTAGAVLPDEMWLGYSSEGPGQRRLSLAKPDLCAPSNFCETRDANMLNSGTSAACAITAGTVAALRTRWSGAAVPPLALKVLLTLTARRPRGGGWSRRLGYGILDAKAAVRALQSQFP